MKSIKIQIGGKSVTVAEVPRKQNKAWRDNLKEEITAVADQLAELAESDISKAGEAEAVVKQALATVEDGLDKAADLLGSYADISQENLDKAYDSEIVEGFMGVLGLAFPFGPLAQASQQLISLSRQ